MPFEVILRRTFCAAHALRLPGGTVEPIHGHNWHVTAVFARTDGGLDAVECVADFHPLQQALNAVLAPWQSANLNDIPPFDAAVNPTAERVAEQIGLQISRNIEAASDVKVVSVEVTEAEGCSARWLP